MESCDKRDGHKPLPWWKRWTSQRISWWLKLIFWLLVIEGVIFVLIPGVTGLISQLSGDQLKP